MEEKIDKPVSDPNPKTLPSSSESYYSISHAERQVIDDDDKSGDINRRRTEYSTKNRLTSTYKRPRNIRKYGKESSPEKDFDIVVHGTTPKSISVTIKTPQENPNDTSHSSSETNLYSENYQDISDSIILMEVCSSKEEDNSIEDSSKEDSSAVDILKEKGSSKEEKDYSEIERRLLLKERNLLKEERKKKWFLDEPEEGIGTYRKIEEREVSRLQPLLFTTDIPKEIGSSKEGKICSEAKSRWFLEEPDEGAGIYKKTEDTEVFELHPLSFTDEELNISSGRISSCSRITQSILVSTTIISIILVLDIISEVTLATNYYFNNDYKFSAMTTFFIILPFFLGCCGGRK